MTISYTFQYQLLPKTWKSPTPPPITGDEQRDLQLTLEYRRIIAPYLTDWLSVLNTWRCILKYIIYPLLILSLIMGIGWTTFLIMLVIVSLVAFRIWVRIVNFQRMVAMYELCIDVVLNQEFGIRLPKILEDE